MFSTKNLLLLFQDSSTAIPPTLCSHSRSYMVVSEKLVNPSSSLSSSPSFGCALRLYCQIIAEGEKIWEENPRGANSIKICSYVMCLCTRGTRDFLARRRQPRPSSATFTSSFFIVITISGREVLRPQPVFYPPRMLGCGEIPVFSSARASPEIS